MKKKIKNFKILYGSEQPKQVTFAITNHCNMVCTTCSFPNIPKQKRKHVDFNEAKSAIDFLVENEVRMISLTGGEPLLHPQLIEICDYITKKGIMISYISTNGILVNEQLCKRLSKTNLNIVGISIDVINGKGYGSTRKINIRKIVPRAKKILDKYGIKTYAGVLLGRHTTPIKNVLNTARKLGFTKIIFSYPQTEMNSSYLAARDIDELKGDLEFWEHLIDDIIREKNRNFYIDIFNTRLNLLEFLAYYKDLDYMFDCPGGVSQFYLDWDLDLFRCLNSNEKFGNIRELNNLKFKCTPCNACTQQAHRDYASFYHAFNTIIGLESALKDFDSSQIFEILRSKKNRKAIGSLIEAYLGGFV